IDACVNAERVPRDVYTYSRARHDPPARDYLKPATRQARQAGGRRSLADDGPGAASRSHQAGMVFGRLQPPAYLHQQPALVRAGTELGLQLVARQEPSPVAKDPGLGREGGLKGGGVRRPIGELEMPAGLIPAVNALLGDGSLDQPHRIEAVSSQGQPALAELPEQRL